MVTLPQNSTLEKLNILYGSKKSRICFKKLPSFLFSLSLIWWKLFPLSQRFRKWAWLHFNSPRADPPGHGRTKQYLFLTKALCCRSIFFKRGRLRETSLQKHPRGLRKLCVVSTTSKMKNKKTCDYWQRWCWRNLGSPASQPTAISPGNDVVYFFPSLLRYTFDLIWLAHTLTIFVKYGFMRQAQRDHWVTQG